MKIKVKYHTDILPLEMNEKGDWVDLRAAQDMKLWEGCSYRIPLGISVELPEGYEAHVAPRSSTFKNWGISSILVLRIKRPTFVTRGSSSPL